MAESIKHMESHENENQNSNIKTIDKIEVKSLQNGKLEVEVFGKGKQKTKTEIDKPNDMNNANQNEVKRQLVAVGINLNNIQNLLKLASSKIDILEAIALKMGEKIIDERTRAAFYCRLVNSASNPKIIKKAIELSGVLINLPEHESGSEMAWRSLKSLWYSLRNEYKYGSEEREGPKAGSVL